MTASLAGLGAVGIVAIMLGCLAVGVAVLIGVGTLAVQWFCIEVPQVQDKELH